MTTVTVPDIDRGAPRGRTLVVMACVAGLSTSGLAVGASIASPTGIAGGLWGLTGACVGLALASSVALMLFSRRPAAGAPAAFLVRGGAFAVPGSFHQGYFVAAQVLLSAATFGSILGIAAMVREAFLTPAVSTIIGPFWVLLGLPALAPLAMVTVPAVVGVLRRRPVIVLTPAGVTLWAPLTRAHYPWAALGPGRPAASDQVGLVVARPDLVTTTGLPLPASTVRVMWTHAWVQPPFLYDAIAYYVDHPDERAAIGTAAGYDRLTTP